MAGKKRDKVRERDITGLKYFQQLLLHQVGCQRDKAGNRELFMDEYCVLILLFLFNPVVTSLRALQQASELKKVQRKLGCPRASLGSLSEATQVFDPTPLREIITELLGQVQPIRQVGRGQLTHELIAVDGFPLQQRGGHRVHLVLVVLERWHPDAVTEQQATCHGVPSRSRSPIHPSHG